MTITDANLVLGRLLPDYFPKIFGPKEDQSLDKVAALEAFEKVKLEVNEFMKTNMSVEEVAMGFVKVANETMCRYDFDHDKKSYHAEINSIDFLRLQATFKKSTNKHILKSLPFCKH